MRCDVCGKLIRKKNSGEPLCAKCFEESWREGAKESLPRKIIY